MIDKNLLVKLFGFYATLINGDTLVLDRWLWLRRRLPKVNEDLKMLDVGCGSGAFTLGAARRGYTATGLSWNEKNQNTAQKRAKILNLSKTTFPVFDLRTLDKADNFISHFDIIINFENIEHILDDRKLIIDIANCLKPGGILLMTTPYFHYHPISKGDIGPFSKVEDGGHVRRGYTRNMLIELCNISGLMVEEITFCSGFFSQKVTAFYRKLENLNPIIPWILILPLRPFIPLLDKLIPFRYYSICLEAYKPRY